MCLPPIAPVASEVDDVPGGQQCLDPLEQHLLCGYLVAWGGGGGGGGGIGGGMGRGRWGEEEREGGKGDKRGKEVGERRGRRSDISPDTFWVEHVS